VTEGELKELLKKKGKKAYIGFEPSGFVHLGWVICAGKILDLLKCGFDVTILMADWHAWINDKFDGDMESIRACGEYMKDCFSALGVRKAKYAWASDFVKDPTYWELVVKIAKNTTLARTKRAMDIMGRTVEEAEKDLSKFFYPPMQVADIFYLDVDLAYGGMDQRHAHMLCREVAKKIGRKIPVALHTPILTGLESRGRMDVKMSKSKASSCIFIHDSAEEIRKKIKNAYCPEGIVNKNPIIEMCKFIIFPCLNREFEIDRSAKYGGAIQFHSYEELEKKYISKEIHPMDLKIAVAEYIGEILKPVRKYFDRHPGNLEEMLKLVKNK
jgi:tyrosyl-tRNA synthetase